MNITAGTNKEISDHKQTLTIIHHNIPRHHNQTKPTLSINNYIKHKENINKEIKEKCEESKQNKINTSTSQEFNTIQTIIQETITKYEKKPKRRSNKEIDTVVELLQNNAFFKSKS